MFVYALLDPHTKEIRYIGKQGGKSDRFAQHMKPSTYNKRKTHLYSWIKNLVKQNLKPVQVILAYCEDQISLNEAEISLIAFYNSTGHRLCNHTAGGDGTAGLKISDEMKANLRAKNLGKKYGESTKKKLSEMRKGEKHPMYGKKRPEMSSIIREANSKAILCSNGQRYSSTTEAAKALNCSISGIHLVLKGKNKHCFGFTFAYEYENRIPVKPNINTKIREKFKR